MKKTLSTLIALIFVLFVCFTLASCGDKEDEPTLENPGTSPHTHILSHISPKNATCEKDGNIEYWSCNCGKKFADSKGETEISGSALTIEATHNYENNVCTFCGASKATEGLEYKINNNKTYTVTGIGTATDTDIVIPSTYNNLSVTEIGASAFKSCTNLTSVTIGENVTSIGTWAFENCINLKNVTIGNNVESIGGATFRNCNNLISITIPESVTKINNGAFFDCRKLFEVINHSSLPITAGSYDNGSVAYNAKIVHSEEKSRIVNKDDYLFITINDINYLLGYTGEDTELILPKSYNGKFYEIDSYAFNNINIKSVVIPIAVTRIGKYAFNECTNLISITFNDTTTWYFTNDLDDFQNKSGGWEEDVTSPSHNATYFKSTYDNYYWYKL